MTTTAASDRARFLRGVLLPALLMLLVFAAGAGVRLYGNAWDQFAALHPDERAIIFSVLDSVRGLDAEPDTPLGSLWFGTGTSPLDPHRGDRFFAYGEFPHLVITSIVALSGERGWAESFPLARLPTSALDTLTILAVFLLAHAALRSAWAALAAGAFYAATPIALQTANFATVDAWATAASAWSLLAATHLVLARTPRKRLIFAALAGVAAGLALACKLPAALLAPALLAASIAGPSPWRARILRAIAPLIVAGLAAFIAFRLGNPYAFRGPGLFDLGLSANWLGDTRQAIATASRKADYPPAWQWHLRRPVIDAAIDLAAWGAGPGLTLAAAAGAAALVRRIRPLAPLLPSLVFAALVLAYFLQGFNPALRYMLPAAPVLAVLAAAPLGSIPRARLLTAASLAGLALTLVWGSGIARLHLGKHPRVAASVWIWQNLPQRAAIANETSWDDGLPSVVRLPGSRDFLYPNDERFTLLNLTLTDPDSADKADKMASVLAQTRYLGQSSERQSAVLPFMGDRFPMTRRYYELLDSGALCFAPVFNAGGRYPLLFWMVDDTWAQEPWSVYDHPRVIVYKKQPCFDAARVRAELFAALPAAQ